MVFPAKSWRFIAPGLRYRQHATNLIGADGGFIAKFSRFGLMLFGRHRQWNTRNIEALLNLREKLTPENRSIYDEFSRSHDASLWNRLAGLYRILSIDAYRKYYPVAGCIIQAPLAALLHDHNFCYQL